MFRQFPRPEKGELMSYFYIRSAVIIRTFMQTVHTCVSYLRMTKTRAKVFGLHSSVRSVRSLEGVFFFRPFGHHLLELAWFFLSKVWVGGRHGVKFKVLNCPWTWIWIVVYFKSARNTLREHYWWRAMRTCVCNKHLDGAERTILEVVWPQWIVKLFLCGFGKTSGDPSLLRKNAQWKCFCSLWNHNLDL